MTAVDSVLEATDWCEDARRELEEAADELLGEIGGEVQTYTERALARKMRIEYAQMPEVEETATPTVAAEYLLQRQIRLLLDSCRLRPIQAAVLALAVEGWNVLEISGCFGLSRQRIERVLEEARRRVTCSRSPYDGLWQVYWQEVNRYVYRRRRVWGLRVES